MTNHPASTIDVEAAAHTFALSLTGCGPHWDATMIAMHPEMALSATENVWYTIDNCIDIGLCNDAPKTGSEEEIEILTQWCQQRAPACKTKMQNIAIADGHVLAHRMIDSNPEDLRTDLGIFWSHDFHNWVDPVTPWGKGRGAFPTLLVEARIPVEAIDWQTSCMALMDWMIGDTESELRLYPGHRLKDVRLSYIVDNKPIAIDEREWTS